MDHFGRFRLINRGGTEIESKWPTEGARFIDCDISILKHTNKDPVRMKDYHHMRTDEIIWSETQSIDDEIDVVSYSNHDGIRETTGL